MDIHRCRFVPYPPRAINALAFSHNADLKQETPIGLRLAIGRENGAIEIWSPTCGTWFQESILRGSQGRTIDQLVWTQDFEVEDADDGERLVDGLLRLFSIGAGPSVVEWNLQTHTVKTVAESNFGDIWCLAAQPRWKRSEQVTKAQNHVEGDLTQLLAAGCHDGSVVLFTPENGELRYLQSLTPPPKKKVKVISLTWRDRNTVVAGYDDSTIRVINVKQKSVLRQMSLGKSPEGGNSVVWAIKCLPDGTILSGDSSGELKIWDARHFALIQRIKAHDGDVLDIATSAAGDTTTTVGVDRRSVIYKPVNAQPGAKQLRWMSVTHRRYHENDVKCCAAYESKDISVIVSGGTDTVPIVSSLRGWQKEYHRKLSHLPQDPPMSSSPKRRLVLTWWDRELYIWHIPKRRQDSNLDTDEPSHHLLATLQLKGDEHIQAAEISIDGRFVIASTAAGTKLFQLRKARTEDKVLIRTRPVELPKIFAKGCAQLVGFSPDQKWLYAVLANNAVLLTKMNAAENPKERPAFHEDITRLTRKQRPSSRSTNALGEYTKGIRTIAFSCDSRILAVGDNTGAIDTWVLEGQEGQEDHDSHDKASDAGSDTSSDSDSDDEEDNPSVDNQRWIRTPSGSQLPQLDSAILSLSFKPIPSSPREPNDEHLGLHPTRHTPNPLAHDLPHQHHSLVAVTASHQVIEFDVLNNKLSDWSRRNPSSYLPTEFQKLTDPIKGCFWDVKSPSQGHGRRERLWMYGTSWICMIDMAHDLAIPKTLKRKRDGTKRRTAGAGGEYHKKVENSTGIGNAITKFKDSEADKQVIVLDRAREDSDEEMQDVDTDKLAVLRRAAMNNESSLNGHNASNEEEESSDPNTSKPSPRPQRTWWMTYKYRSILGICVIGRGMASDDVEDSKDSDAVAQQIPNGLETSMTGKNLDEANDEDDEPNSAEAPPRYEDNLEVVIVERPLHDVAQPPRFDDRRDWES